MSLGFAIAFCVSLYQSSKSSKYSYDGMYLIHVVQLKYATSFFFFLKFKYAYCRTDNSALVVLVTV